MNKSTNIKKISIVIVFLIFLFNPLIAFTRDFQYKIIQIPCSTISEESKTGWLVTGIDKMIEYSLEKVSIYGIKENRKIYEDFKTFATSNPYKMKVDHILPIGIEYNSNYIIVPQFDYKDGIYEVKTKIIDVSESKLLTEINSSGDIEDVLLIGDKILEFMIKHHNYKPNQGEEQIIKRTNEFIVSENATAFWCMGYEQFQKKDYQQALYYFQRAYSITGSFSDNSRMIGVVRTLIGDYFNAEKRLKEAIGINKQNYRVWRDLGKLQLQIGITEEKKGNVKYANAYYQHAANTFSKALQLRVIDDEIFTLIADINYKLGYFGNAKTWYSDAYYVNPSNIRALEGLTKIYGYKDKDLEKAYEYASELYYYDNENYVALSVLANYFATIQGDYKKAVEILKTAVMINPDYIQGHLILGKLYTKMYLDGDMNRDYLSSAIEAYNYCIGNNYYIPDIYIEMAKLYAILGNGDKCAYYIDKAFNNGYENINKIVFDTTFDNVKNNSEFLRVVNYWLEVYG